jgi:hypothetical protein
VVEGAAVQSLCLGKGQEEEGKKTGANLVGEGDNVAFRGELAREEILEEVDRSEGDLSKKSHGGGAPGGFAGCFDRWEDLDGGQKDTDENPCSDKDESGELELWGFADEGFQDENPESGKEGDITKEEACLAKSGQPGEGCASGKNKGELEALACMDSVTKNASCAFQHGENPNRRIEDHGVVEVRKNKSRELEGC